MKLSILLLLTVITFGGKSFAATQASISISAAPVYGEQCLQYTFFIRPGLNDNETAASISAVTWNFGDGNTVTLANQVSYNANHGYLLSGTYEVRATVTCVTNGNTITYDVYTFFSVIGNNNFNGAGFSMTGIAPTFVFTFTGVGFNGTSQTGHSYTLDFGDGTTATTGGTLTAGQTIASHTYAGPGNYTVTMTHNFVQHPVINCQWIFQYQISIPEDPCCSNFAPDPGKDYWLSAWVQEDVPAAVMSYSNNVYIELEFVVSGGNQIVRIERSGEIIEGWQRIVGKFTVPANATDMNISMVNTNAAVKAYFDDIRIHPFNGSMKSYVYNPETLLLDAELDDNNFATIYEYDKEGQLIRIKKETQRGIMTIQENRTSNPKNN